MFLARHQTLLALSNISSTIRLGARSFPRPPPLRPRSSRHRQGLVPAIGFVRAASTAASDDQLVCQRYLRTRARADPELVALRHHYNVIILYLQKSHIMVVCSVILYA